MPTDTQCHDHVVARPCSTPPRQAAASSGKWLAVISDALYYLGMRYLSLGRFLTGLGGLPLLEPYIRLELYFCLEAVQFVAVASRTGS